MPRRPQAAAAIGLRRRTGQMEAPVVGRLENYFPRGLKPPNHFLLFMYGLKPVPFN